MAGRSVACVDRKVLLIQTHTHIKCTICRSAPYAHSLECLLCTCTGASVCLPVITHALPTPPFSACAMTVHLGGMVCHFLSSVHRTSVITEARARLFYRTSYKGRSDDCTLLLSARSIFFPSFTQSLLHCFHFYFLVPFLSLTDTLTLFLCLLSHTHACNSHFQSGRAKEGNSGKRKVKTTIDFFNHCPITLSTDKLCCCQTDWKDICF